jgi:hypothetical protein
MNRQDWKVLGLRAWAALTDDWAENLMIAVGFYFLGWLVGKYL